MSRDQSIGILVAVAFHLLALFAFRLSTPPSPLPIGNDPIQVSLVAAAPENATDLNPPAAEAATAPLSETLAPEPTPASIPVATPPPSTPIPEAKAKPARHPKTTPPPAHKSAPAKATAKKTQPQSAKTSSASARSGTATGGGRGDAAPSYRNNPQPPYPEEARRLEQQGLVILDVLVGANGRAVSVSVRQSSRFRALDQAAVAAVRQWIFQPGRVAGVPVAGHVNVPVRFRIER